MTDFGGLGGFGGTLDFDEDFKEDLFAQALNKSLGNQMREDDSLCVDVWCALANIEWVHTNGDTASYSFRAAGDLIASIKGEGDYLDWYCSGGDGVVSSEIFYALKDQGWKPVDLMGTPAYIRELYE